MGKRGLRVALVSTHSSDTWGRWVLPQAFSFLLWMERRERKKRKNDRKKRDEGRREEGKKLEETECKKFTIIIIIIINDFS